MTHQTLRTSVRINQQVPYESALQLQAGVDLAGVNIMTMNFGEGWSASQSMAEATKVAVAATNRQLESAYLRNDQRLSYEQVQAKIRITPMIGQNDDAQDVLTPPTPTR